MADLTGTSGPDNITGTGNADRIRGLAGNDRLDGAGGADTLLGGSDNDTLNGGVGADALFGGSGHDILNGGGSADTLFGGSGADELRGRRGNDILDGENGADTLRGYSGDDKIIAGRGNDVIDGGSGFDRVEAAGTLDQYAFTLLGGDAVRMIDEIPSRDGRDRIDDVEAIIFKDRYELLLTGENNNPYGVADTAETAEGVPVLIDVLANDFDPDTTIFGKASTLSLFDVGEPTRGGTVTISDGKALYDPGNAFDFLNAGETGFDTFFYRVADGKGGFWTATATVTITGTGSTPSIDLGSLDGTTGFRLDGASNNDYSGGSVASAGDVNGDGFDDVIVGAFLADPDGIASGASYVVFGHAGGFSSALDLSTLDGKIGFRLDGVAEQDRSGYSVASAGDLNGDGFGDLIIGAPARGFYSDAASYVVFGKSGDFAASLDLSTLDGKTGFRLDGGGGYAVASAGDVNGDGLDDLIIGSRNSDPADTGSTFVVFGKTGGFAASFDLSTLDGKTGFRLDGVARNDQSGFSVASAGDVNGDGLDDLIIGAVVADTGGFSSGASYVVFGKAGGFTSTLDLASLDGKTGFRLDGAAPFDFSGFSVASAGDVNGDGVSDLIIGASGAGPLNNGAAFVVFGHDGDFDSTLNLATLDGATGFRLDGVSPRDYAGASVASAGDFNGDGFDDVIIGAAGADTGGDHSGASYVVFGKAGGFAPALDLVTLDGVTNGIRLDGAASDDRSGAVASAGDVNGDGFDDLIVGAPGADPGGTDSGASYVVFGRDFGASSSQIGIADVLGLSDGANSVWMDGTANETATIGSGWATEISGSTAVG